MKTRSILKILVGINSVFPNEMGIERYLYEYLSGLGFRIKRIPTAKNRNNIIATYGNSSEYLGFYAHIDTVPVDKNYTRNPFKLYVENDKAFGLGTEDMKGGISAILQLADFAVSKNLSVKIIFGVDEENISMGAHDLINSEQMNDVSFLISAESGQIKNLNQKYSLCLGRKGRVLFRATVSGKRSHAASDKGINAIENMALFLTNIRGLKFRLHPRLGETKLVAHSIEGNIDSFSVPDSCTCTISALTNPYISSKDVQKELESIGKKLGIKLKIEQIERETPYNESYEINLSDPFLNTLQENVFSPDRVRGIYTGSVADENVFANRLNIPVISLGPIGGNGHIADEWVSLSSIENVSETYKKILQIHEGKTF